MLIGHGTLVVFLPSNIDTIVRTLNPYRLLTASPWVGVWIFFVLSGYLMGKGFFGGRYALDRKGIFQFYGNRILRIAPIYWSAILIVAAIQARGVFQPDNLPGFVSSLLFFQSIDLPFVVIGALWSVQTEMGFYLAAPYLFIGLSRLTERFPTLEHIHRACRNRSAFSCRDASIWRLSRTTYLDRFYFFANDLKS